MKYVKQLLIFFVVGLLGFVLFYGSSEGLSSLFVFPLLFLSLFLGYYLYLQWQVEEKEHLNRGIRYAVADIEAEQWMKTTFAPYTLSKIKKHHWTIIIYSFLIIGIASFVWSYLSFGMMTAIQNFFYGSFLFWLFTAYTFGLQPVFFRLYRRLPKRLQVFLSGDWEQAYFFLFPISFVIYLLFPFSTVWNNLWMRFSRFPLFFLIYTFVFLALYSLISIVEDMQRDEEKHLQKEIEKYIHESEK